MSRKNSKEKETKAYPDYTG